MVYLLSLGIDCISAVIFLIPAIFILQYVLLKQYDINKTMILFIFSCYIMAVFSVVGLPTLYSLKAELRFNLIPLIDIVHSPVEYMKNTVLNIILFVPMGFLLPIIWKEYRQAKKTIWMGFAVSFAIEVMQIFTFRLTDIDDLITNTLGTILGYYAAKMISFKLPLKISKNRMTENELLENRISENKLSGDTEKISTKYEPMIILVTVFLIGFFLKPLVSNAMWDRVLSGSLWESIK